MKDFPLLIAVDPGKLGGVSSALLDPDTGLLGSVASVGMPESTKDLNDYIGYLTDARDKVVVFIECIQMFQSDLDKQKNPGKAFQLQKLHANVSRLKTVFEIRGHQVHDVYPKSWQSFLHLKGEKDEPKTDRKNRYKAFAQSLFPTIQVNLKKSDSLCILEFGRRKCIYDGKKYFS